MLGRSKQATSTLKISRRERGWLLAAGLVLLASLAGVYVVEPLLAHHARVKEEALAKRGVLERFAALAAEKDRHQRTRAALRSQVRETEAVLLNGGTLPLVAAELQGLLHRLAQEAGLTIVTENVPPPKTVDPYHRVAVELSVRGELRALTDFLYAVQTAPKLLAVPHLLIRGGAMPGQTLVSADLRVVGYSYGGVARE